MTLNYRKKVDTKKKALKLIYDPTCLLSLLYSKYGDVEEDYDLLMINQIVYDRSSRYNIIFKEYQYIETDEEFLKRWYKLDESINRIPKLSDYYKNYHMFFCRPNFNDFIVSDLIHNYGDDKAELFYKNNFEFTNSETDEDFYEKNNTSSLSSLDNITNNKTIFTNKNLFIIEKNENSINYSMTLTLNNTTINSIQNNKKNLVSARSIKDSFEKIVHNLVYYQKKKQNKKNSKKIKESKSKKNKNNKNENSIKKSTDNQPIKLINTINYLDKNKNKSKKCNANNNYITNNKDKKNPPQLNILTKTQSVINHNNNHNNITKIKGLLNNNNILNTILKIFNSPKNCSRGGVRHTSKTKYHSKLEEYNNNCKNHIQKSNNIHHQRNKTYNFSQNYSLNNYSCVLNAFENINYNLKHSKALRKTTSQSREKFNYILTLNNINRQQPKKSRKNKTFENNIFNTQINQISSMPFLKYKMTSPSNMKISGQYKPNKNFIKNNNFIGSKFSLVKNMKINSNNNIDKNRGKKQTSYNYYQNILNQIMPDNNNMKKNINKTSFGINNNTSNSSHKNKSISPINSNKDSKNYNNNDFKNRNRFSKNQINNFNINFNNVYLTSSKPASYIVDNNKSNINNSHAYSSINVNKNINNNSLSNNLTSNNFINTNILEHDNKSNKNLYVMNLKNIYNFSRNKNNILINNNPLTQTESHHSKIQNNYNIIHNPKNNYSNNLNKNKEAKILIEKNFTNGNLKSQNGFDDMISNKIQNQNYKKSTCTDNQRMSNEIISFIRKSQNNFVMRNQNKNNIDLFKNKTNNILNTKEDINKNNLKNNKSFNCSKNIYSSSSVSRRNNKCKITININNGNNGIRGQNPHGKKISSLTSQKNIKSKYKRKIQQ